MKALISFAPIAILITLSGCGRQPSVHARLDTGPVEVRVAPVVSRTLQRTVEAVGTLYPYDEVIVSAEVEGRIDQVNVDLGDKVKEGQVLARISEEEQRYLVQQNDAQLRQALEKLGLKNERDKVKDVRETPDVRRAQADLFDAEQRYKRVRELVDQKVGSMQDLDQAQARFQSARAALDASIYQTRNLIQEVDRYKAVLDLQRKKLRDTTVRAPFSGAVKERQVTMGLFVRPNTPLFTIVKTDPVRLRVEMPERMAPWIKAGQMAEVSLEAFGGRKFKGKIWRISPTVDQNKRTFVVEALIDNPSGELKPGSYARARVKTDKAEEISLVPVRAVNYVLGSNKVYIVRGDAVEPREVKLGERFEEDVEILEGALREGEHVAMTQLPRLESGGKIKVAEGAPAGRKGE